MEELVRARIQQVVNKIVRVDSNIDPLLLEEYKEAIVNSVCDLFAALHDMYNNQDELSKSVDAFVKSNLSDYTKLSKNGFETDGYLLAMVPILIPIELIGMIDDLPDDTLPIFITFMSVWFIRMVTLLTENQQLSDTISEKESNELAQFLKMKGWVA